MKSDKNAQITGLLSPFLERTRLQQAACHIPDRAAVLDIGCGQARILRYISPPARTSVWISFLLLSKAIRLHIPSMSL
jgi:hypothetical protein